jgi:tetratricopeptide (TPR) repeat protein
MDIGRGYEFIYTNNTAPGMSGGPILNREGQLIGIHGRGERDQVAIKERGLSENTKTAVNQGIPISYIEPNIKSGPIDEQETKNYLATIQRAARHWGREQIALKMINKLITKDPSSKAFYVRGRIKIDLEKTDSAIEDFRKSLSIDPTNHYSMYSLGYTLYKNEKFDESIEIITNLIQAKPEAMFIQMSAIVVADILNMKGEYENAVELAEEAIRIDPKRDNGYLVLGRIYRKQKRWNDAIEAYRRCPRMTAQLSAESAYTNIMTKDGGNKAWQEINLAIRMHEMFGDKADMARLDKPSSAYAFRALLNTFQGKCSKAKLDISKAQSLNKLNQKVRLVDDVHREKCSN